MPPFTSSVTLGKMFHPSTSTSPLSEEGNGGSAVSLGYEDGSIECKDEDVDSIRQMLDD